MLARAMSSPPVPVTFHQLFPGAPPPRRADPTLFGAMPLRAHRHCEPFAAASGFGWHIFSPMDFLLRWDGTTIFWMHSGAPQWMPLQAAAFPGFEAAWARHRPASAPAAALPFLMAIREPGIVQIWSGLVARTPPAWSLLIRPPANLPRSLGYEVLEGLVETDWWSGPLLSNVRLCRTDEPILFRAKSPLFQAQLVPRAAYSEETLDGATITDGLDQLDGDGWSRLTHALELRTPQPGAYKAEARRRRKSVDQ
jgi:hypothetical protein